MSNINRILMTGNLGADVAIQYTAKSGTMVGVFNIAVTSSGKKNEQGEYEPITEWFRCVAYGKRAEIIEKHFKKGDKIIIEGKLSSRSWEGEDGKRVYITEIVVNNFDFGGKSLRNQEAQGEASIPTNIPAPEDFEEPIPF